MALTHSLFRTSSLRVGSALVVAGSESPDLAGLLQGSRHSVRLLPADGDPLQAITDHLRACALAGTPVQSLHLVAHGRPGAVRINGSWLTPLELLAGAALLAQWKVKEIALWSCYLAQDPSFTAVLAELTGANVLASRAILGSHAATEIHGHGVTLAMDQIFFPEAVQAWGGELVDTTNFDVAGAILNFGNPIKQPINGTVLTPNGVGTQWVYSNVITVNGQQIDAVVTLNQTSSYINPLNNTAYSTGSVSVFDSTLQQYNASTDSTVLAYWQPTISINNNGTLRNPSGFAGATGGSAKFTISFIKGETYIPSTANTVAFQGEPVTLQNVILNSYDIDGIDGTTTFATTARQFVELDQVGSFKVTATSKLSVISTATGICFKSSQAGDIQQLPGTQQGDDVRFQVNYSSISSLGITLGDVSSQQGSGVAYFAVDFGTGRSFSVTPTEYKINLSTSNNCVTVNECGSSIDVFVSIQGSSSNSPTGNILVNLSGFNPGEFTISSSDFVSGTTQLLFTPDDFARGELKKITITGVDDALLDGDTLSSLRLVSSAAVVSGSPSSNDFYNNLNTYLKIINLDNDTLITDASAYECDSFATFTVVGAAGRVLNFAVQDVTTSGMATAPIWISSNAGISYQLYTSNYVVPGTSGQLSLQVRVGLSPEQVVTGEGVETFKLIVTSPDVTCPREATGSIFSLSSIGDRVWLDSNANGIQDSGEAGIADAQVYLLDANGQRINDASGNPTTTFTDGTGAYKFDCLMPGSYRVEFVKPIALDALSASNQLGDPSLDSDPIFNPTTGSAKTGTISLAATEVNDSIDAGFYSYAKLSGTVYFDSNNDGALNNGESGIGDITLILTGTDGLGNTLSPITTTTDANGNYSFSNLVPGTYTVSEAQPIGYLDGKDSVGTSGGTLANDSISAISLASGVNATGYNFGEILAGSIGDRLWADNNVNGLQDDGEEGLAGRTVTLISGGTDGLLITTGDNPAPITTTTDSNGNYLFAGLRAGEYQVYFGDIPTGTVFSTADAGSDDSLDSDVDASGYSPVISLAAGQTISTLDAGVYAPASLGDKVWIDANGNGLQDTGEQGLSDVTIYLTDGSGTRIKVGGNDVFTTTAADGAYSFGGLRPGTYGIEVVAPSGYAFTAADQGGNDAADSDVVAVTEGSSIARSGSVTLVAGQNNTSLDAGVYGPASLAGKVYVDANNNGTFDPGEAGIDNVSLSLSRTDAFGNTVTLTASTDSNGNYTFTNLAPGVYTLIESQPSGYVDGLDSLGSTGGTLSNDRVDAITLSSGAAGTGYNFGEFNRGLISDRLWLDTNGDGLQNDEATGISGQTVTLISGGADGLLSTTGDNATSTTTTGTDGFYAFDDLAPGEYRVEFSAPTGTVFTAADAGPDDALDSDVNAAGQSATNTLANGQRITSLDAGVYVPVSIGDTIWEDSNGDGIQNGSEQVLSGVTVFLTDGNTRISQGGSPISAITDANGFYSFLGLRPGSYGIEVVRPTGFQFTDKDQGIDDTADSDVDSTGKSAAVTLLSGASTMDLDAGLYRPATFGNRVWDDLNANGLQDANEPGLAGVTLYLLNLDAVGNTVRVKQNGVDVTRVSDSTGAYSFTGLKPGAYGVEVGSTPSGYFVTSQGVDPSNGSDPLYDALDSNLDPATFRSDFLVLASGESNDSLDLGLYKLASVGDRVWEDTNGNGIQDVGELGTANVVVQLFDATGSTLISSTTTNPSGLYSFGGLRPGDYSLAFSNLPLGAFFSDTGSGTSTTDSDANSDGNTAAFSLSSGENNTSLDAGWNRLGSIGDVVWLDSNANGIQDANESGLDGVTVSLYDEKNVVLIKTTTTSTTADGSGSYSFTGLKAGKYVVRFTTPAGYTLTDKDIGADDATDSDADSTGKTAVITVNSGQSVTTVDAGYYQTATLGDRVWNDVNSNGIQDSGESGLANVTVGLYKADGTTLISNTTSTTTGAYSFSGLRPGDYVVKATKPSSAWVFSPIGSNPSSEIDSNVDAATGKSGVITLRSGETNNSIDIGLYQGSTTSSGGDLQISKSDGYSSVVAGQRLTYTITVRNVGANAAANVLVSDVMPTNLSGVTWTSRVDSGSVSGLDASGSGNINDTITSMGANSSVTYVVSGTVVKPGISASSTATSFNFIPTSSSSSGSAGNVRSYSSGVVTLTAKAFSREALSSGSICWTNAFLGAYATANAAGLGITNSSEGSGNYRIDNVGSKRDYLMLQFSESVVLDRVALQAVLTDSDATVWIGNSSSSTLTDAVLSSLGSAEQNSGSSSNRTADVNAASRSGNTVVISASNLESSCNDNFTVAGLDVFKLVTSASTITNTATVTGPSGYDSTLSNNSASDVDTILTAPGCRTPGFWINKTWPTFWDGNASNQPTQAGSTGFATGDLLFAPYQTGQQGTVKDPVTGASVAGVLIGDWNRNGITDNGEQTIFYRTDEALMIMDSSKQPDRGDVRYTLARSLTASWLNYVAGNPVDTASTTDKDARVWINQGITWLQQLKITPDENGDGLGDGMLSKLADATGQKAITSPYIKARDSRWTSSSLSIGTTSISGGNIINSNLDAYNNGNSLLADG